MAAAERNLWARKKMRMSSRPALSVADEFVRSRHRPYEGSPFPARINSVSS
jgi:hypothetical protein